MQSAMTTMKAFRPAMARLVLALVMAGAVAGTLALPARAARAGGVARASSPAGLCRAATGLCLRAAAGGLRAAAAARRYQPDLPVHHPLSRLGGRDKAPRATAGPFASCLSCAIPSD